MNKLKSSWLGFFLLGTVLVTSCDKADNPEPQDENELITTLNLKFTESGTSNQQTFTFRDADGEGGQAPSKFDNITLKANTTYRLDVEVLDESKNPSENITSEIEEKKDEHLFVYTITPAGLGTYTYGDKDSKSLNVGLTGSLRTAAAGTGKFRVQLRHQSGTKDGTPAPGSNDIEVEFNLTVN